MKSIAFSLVLSLMMISETFASEVVKVRVFKSERRLTLVDKNNNNIKTYSISLGRSPVGHKERQGDNKTPEGSYILDYKKPDSAFYKAIHVNYPNKKDIEEAKKKGIKDPGDSIMIHGLPNNISKHTEFLAGLGLNELAEDLVRLALPYIDWTQGCIAVKDSDMDEIYKLVKTPTPIFIYP